jgi:hypothetical protein
MDELFATIRNHPHKDECVRSYIKDKGALDGLDTKETKWGATVRRLVPAKLTSAWLMLEDPLMALAGSSYKTTETRDKTFELQQEASANLRGHRKLSKVKVGEALSAVRPTEEQTKVIAGVLYAMKQIQTVCYDEEKKIVWTVPEDLRAWSKGSAEEATRTLWVNSRCDQCLDWQAAAATPESFGTWLDEREKEGWTIPWPIADGSAEELKQTMAKDFSHIVVRPLGLADAGKKPKKEDYARVLGKCQAIQHLNSI